MHKPLLALLLVGCSADCPTFEEVEVTDPDGLGAPGVIGRLQAAIDDFAGWSGREGVCVEEVRLEQPADESWDGSYSGDLIRISPRIEADPSATVWHELCHGLDAIEELSWPNRELFPAVPDAESERGGVGETFARTCEGGAEPMALLDVLMDCGSAADQFMHDVVWTGREPATDLLSAPIGMARRDIAGMPADGYATTLATSADGAYLGLSDDAIEGETVSIIRIDPTTSAVAATIAGPVVSPDGSWALLGGDDDPLLVAFDGVTQAWRIVGDTLVPAAFPAGITELSSGIVADGAAWANARIDGEWTFVRIDLDTLAITDLPDAVADRRVDLRFLRAGETGVSAPWTTSGDLSGIGRLSTTDLIWTLDEAPGHLLPLMSLDLPDGRVLVRWLAAGLDSGAYGFALFDPDTGAWTFDTDACGANSLNPSGNLALLDGKPYWFEWADADGVHAAHGLVEITLPPR